MNNRDLSKFQSKRARFLDCNSGAAVKMKCIVSISKLEVDAQIKAFFQENQMSIFATLIDTIYGLDNQKKGMFSIFLFFLSFLSQANPSAKKKQETSWLSSGNYLFTSPMRLEIKNSGVQFVFSSFSSSLFISILLMFVIANIAMCIASTYLCNKFTWSSPLYSVLFFERVLCVETVHTLRLFAYQSLFQFMEALQNPEEGVTKLVIRLVHLFFLRLCFAYIFCKFICYYRTNLYHL